MALTISVTTTAPKTMAEAPKSKPRKSINRGASAGGTDNTHSGEDQDQDQDNYNVPDFFSKRFRQVVPLVSARPNINVGIVDEKERKGTN
jgi:hypothetical protein